MNRNIARLLTISSLFVMSLAGPEIAAAQVLVIDGCPQECARKTMELAGFKNFQHLRLADLGFEKGRTRVTVARIRHVADRGAELLIS